MDKIDISIVVPTCAREEKLRQCLRSLLSQDYPRAAMEIIVVDDRASKKTEEIIGTLKDAHSNLIYIAQYRKGPAAVRNAGVRQAQGEIVAFVDDDCVVACDWVRLMKEAHKKNTQIAAIGGDTYVDTKRIHILISQFLSTCSIETDIEGRKEVIFFPTCNVSFKKHVFEKYSFDEKFPLPGGEDLEFFWRLYKRGFRFLWNKDIKVMHCRTDTAVSFIKQAYIYGRGNLLVQYLHRDHPLLRELKTGTWVFWMATLVNTLKIPRFGYILGKKFIRQHGMKKKALFKVGLYFAIHKIFYILGTIREFFRVRKGFAGEKLRNPRLLILDIVHSCNLTCKICDIWKTQKKSPQLPLVFVKSVLTQAKKLGIREIALSGGEPLLREDIFDIFEHARRIGIKNLGVLTNGIMIETCLWRLKAYLADHTISLVVSLDSLKPQVHNMMRNSETAWEKTMAGLNMLASLKKEIPTIHFHVISIVLNKNLSELSALAQFIRSLGADSLQFQVLLPNNLRMAERTQNDFWVTEDAWGSLDIAIDQVLEFKAKHPDFIRNTPVNLSAMKKYYRKELTFADARCYSADSTVLISNQGECTTCFSSYGDIKRETLKDILAGPERLIASRQVKNCHWPCLLPCFCERESEIDEHAGREPSLVKEKNIYESKIV